MPPKIRSTSSQRSGSAAWTGESQVIVSEPQRRGAFQYDMAMNAGGDAIMAWRDFSSDGPTDTYTVKAKRFTQGTWQATEQIVETVDATTIRRVNGSICSDTRNTSRAPFSAFASDGFRA